MLAVGLVLLGFTPASVAQPSPDAATLQTAIALFRKGSYVRAYALLAPLVQGKRSWWNAHYTFAICGRMLRRPLLEIVGQLRTSLALSPENPFAYAALGKTYLEYGRPKSAIEPLRRAVQLSPQAHSTRWLLVRAYDRSGRFSDALAELLRLGKTKEYKQSYALKHALARVYERVGRLAEAERLLQAMTAEGNRQFEHRVALYRFYLRHRMLEKARKLLLLLVPAPTSRPTTPTP